jgi:hypothetical protein
MSADEELYLFERGEYITLKWISMYDRSTKVGSSNLLIIENPSD